MQTSLNKRGLSVVERMLARSDELRIAVRRCDSGARIIDAGIDTAGGTAAGLELARLCLADLADVSLVTVMLGSSAWPGIQVSSEHPVLACLGSQYAGWQIAMEDYFGMGSGPMRAAAAREDLFKRLNISDSASAVVGVIESAQIPTTQAVERISQECGVTPSSLVLVVAPTSSPAGSVQIVARSVETALHKLLELGFEMDRIRSGWGIAPLPPVAHDDLSGIGRTNDSILYGAHVILEVSGDDESLREVGPLVPASASSAHGQTFLEIFEGAGRDFYAIDPHLFSPAVITLQNHETGSVMSWGDTFTPLLQRSFGIETSRKDDN